MSDKVEMTMDRAPVEAFVAQKTLALVGVSARGRGFGLMALRELRKRGFTVHVVHPVAETIDGLPAYRFLNALPEPVGGLLVIVSPAAGESVVEQAVAAGIKRVWFQQGAESSAAIARAQRAGLEVVAGRCILMFTAGQSFPHNLHRWVAGLLGRLPA